MLSPPILCGHSNPRLRRPAKWHLTTPNCCPACIWLMPRWLTPPAPYSTMLPGLLTTPGQCGGEWAGSLFPSASRGRGNAKRPTAQETLRKAVPVSLERLFASFNRLSTFILGLDKDFLALEKTCSRLINAFPRLDKSLFKLGELFLKPVNTFSNLK